MKKIYISAVLCFSIILASAQSLDFKNTIYYTASGNTLTSSAQNLSTLNFTTTSHTHPLFTNGIYFPVTDFQGQNIWVKLKYLQADPNGTSVGANITSTCGDPFRAGFGGWGGFLLQFEIYKDINLTGARGSILNGLFPANITVESIETLSSGELVSFEIQNAESTNWALNSVNFTGNNPTSKPGFSSANIPWPGYQPPPGFSPTFPAASKNIYVVDYGSGSYYAEFRMSADNVSQFKYGYEFVSKCAGYQGMNMSFGVQSATPVNLVSFNASDKNNNALLQWKTASEINTKEFIVQKSFDGITFQDIDKVTAKGSGNYNYNDLSLQGICFYRLEIVDFNGRITYSPIAKLQVSVQSLSINVFPNPATKFITVNGLSGKGNLRILNTLGQVVLNQPITTEKQLINVENLNKGMYIIECLSNQKLQKIKLVKN